MLHELLSSSGWINPQIDFLLFLQNIRENFGGSGYFMFITRLGEFLIPTLVMSIIYWCIDFKTGLYLLTLNVINLLMAQILKLSACVYRPWIISDKIQPLESAMRTASGYSFPSGHTAIASIWAGLAYVLRKKMVYCCLFVIIILLIAFSRMYVGVHTPQDVIVALIIIFVTIFAVDIILNICEQDNKKYLYTLAIIDLAILLAFIYVLVKNYPIDYVDGKMLVNPQKAIYGAIINSGWIGGLINGALLCARFFPINTKEMTIKQKIIISTLGWLIFTPVYLLLDKYVYHYSGQSYILALSTTFLAGFMITGVYPFIFTKFNKKSQTT